jgi:mono/diheme cytochrome c family protein/glucose/arabinose dehydrogenase
MESSDILPDEIAESKSAGKVELADRAETWRRAERCVVCPARLDLELCPIEPGGASERRLLIFPLPRSFIRTMLSRSILFISFASVLSAAEGPDAFPPKPPVQPLSAEESLKKVQLPAGYRLELVLSEPAIKEPVAIAFDGDGRMYVVEMRTYMQDADATGQHEKRSCVSVHEDLDGDGVYEKHTTFADNLLIPRMVLPLGKGRAIIGETDTSDLFTYTDTDGDGKADTKEIFYAGGKRGGNMEHQPSGLVWCLDNWIYTTYNAYRLRWTPQGAVKEPAAANGGQWGLTQDDFGKQWFINGGGERGPMDFQVPIVYGALNLKGQTAPGYETVWPAIGLYDFQGGTGRARKQDGTLNHFTATCGADIYRGDRLPAELRGNLFFGEPVGRLVRRTKVEMRDGLTYLSNPHGEGEFLRSSDPLFRPLNMSTAPDGTLYIVDMYRGIIQEGNWTRPDSYLRKVVDQYQMAKPIGRGRIWRLVHESTKRGPAPKMNSEKPAQLVAHLAHPNGWWRDTAQKLIILAGDKSVAPALARMARTHADTFARLHALWTLEGLDAADAALVREKLKDAQPQIRAAAIRVSESLIKKGDITLANEVLTMANDQAPEVALQAGLTANLLKLPEAKNVLATLATASPSIGTKEIANAILNPPKQQTGGVKLTPEEQKTLAAGAEIYNTLCAACHAQNGKGAPLVGAAPGAMLAPSLAGSKTINGPREGSILVLLHGLSGEIDGKKYEGQMVPMATNDDKWIANVLSFVRNSFGNRAGFVKPDDVTRIRAAHKARTQPWTSAELRAAVPQPLANRKDWKLTASHNSAGCNAAIDNNPSSRYDTQTSQVPGMWFQIELPQPMKIGGIELDAASSKDDYPRGYKVELSTDGKAWSLPVATGKGSSTLTDISFAPATAKFIRITQTGAVNGLFWSIHELNVFAAK